MRVKLVSVLRIFRMTGLNKKYIDIHVHNIIFVHRKYYHGLEARFAVSRA